MGDQADFNVLKWYHVTVSNAIYNTKQQTSYNSNNKSGDMSFSFRDRKRGKPYRSFEIAIRKTITNNFVGYISLRSPNSELLRV